MIDLKEGYYQASDMAGVIYLGETLPSDCELISPEDFIAGIQSAGDNMLTTKLSEQDEPIFLQLLRDYGVDETTRMM